MKRYYNLLVFYADKYKNDEYNFINDCYGEEIVVSVILTLNFENMYNEAFDLIEKYYPILSFTTSYVQELLVSSLDHLSKASGNQLNILNDILKNWLHRQEIYIKGELTLHEYAANQLSKFIGLLKVLEIIDRQMESVSVKNLDALYNRDMFEVLLITNLEKLDKQAMIDLMDLMKHIQTAYTHFAFYDSLENYLEEMISNETIPEPFKKFLILVVAIVSVIEVDQDILRSRVNYVLNDTSLNLNFIDFFDSYKLQMVDLISRIENAILSKITEIENVKLLKTKSKKFKEYSDSLVSTINSLSFESHHILIQKRFGNKVYIEEKNLMDGINKYLISAEYYWNELKPSTEELENDIIPDYIANITLFIKSIEVYLNAKVTEFSNLKIDNKYISIRTIYGNDTALKNVGAWKKKVTLKSFIGVLHTLNNDYYKDGRLKYAIDRLNFFTKYLRNSHFHTTMISSYNDAANIRIQCLEIIKILVISFM
jgi:hypothetical protein